jgi:hypothetical protein
VLFETSKGAVFRPPVPRRGNLDLIFKKANENSPTIIVLAFSPSLWEGALAPTTDLKKVLGDGLRCR